MAYHLLQQRSYRTLVMYIAGLLCMMYEGSMLVGCGGSATAAHSYVYTDTTQVEFLTWQGSSSQGQVTGQWSNVSYLLPLASKSQPLVSPPMTLTGTVNDGSVQLSGGMLSVNGTISNNTLQIRSSTTSGQLVDQTWVPASQQEYNDLVAAFNIYMPLQGALTDLGNITKYPLDDSNPSTLNDTLTQAQNYVKLLKDKVGKLQTAPIHADQC